MYLMYIMNIENILEEWKTFVSTKMIPIVKRSELKLEGNIYSYHMTTDYCDMFLEKQKNIIIASTQPGVKNILEIGFNSGFSVLLMLIANPEVRVVCVDNNIWDYMLPCYNFMKEQFGDRIQLHIGNSVDVLPTIQEKFDLIHMDGSHVISVLERDVINAIALSKDRTILIMDDTDYGPIDDLWKRYIIEYKLKNCDFDIFNAPQHSIKIYEL